MSSLRNDIIIETYLDLKKMIYMITHRMARRYHIPFEDLIGVSHEIFIKACHAVYASENPQHRQHVTSWVYAKVQWGLLSFMRKEYKHLHLSSLEYAPEPSCSPNHFMMELHSELSQDAQTIVDLILDSKSDFALLCRWHKTRTRTAFLSTLTEHLEDMGWSRERIKAHLDEISQVLRGAAATVPSHSFWSNE